VSRDRGDVYMFGFPEEMGGPHPVVIVSRPTNRSTLIALFITKTPHDAIDVVSVASLTSGGPLRGYIRCDQPYVLVKDSPEWLRFIVKLNDVDLATIELGMKAALGIRREGA